jgi:hypothetical protein
MQEDAERADALLKEIGVPPGMEDGEERAGYDAELFQAIRAEIAELLFAPRPKGSPLPPKDQAKNVVTDLLWRTLDARFKLLEDGAGRAYVAIPKEYGCKQIHRVVRIDKHNPQWIGFMDRYFGIHAGERVFDHATEQIGVRVLNEKATGRVHELCQYDEQTGTLYLCFGDEIVKIANTGKITFIENGDDRFFILHKDAEPVDKDELHFALLALQKADDGAAIPGGALDIGAGYASANFPREMRLTNYLFDGVPFDEGAAITPRMAQRLILSGFVSLMFNPAEKPVFYFLGDSDTGKTHLLRKMAYIVYGPEYDVTSIGQEPRDFANTLINNYFLLLDDMQDEGGHAGVNSKKLVQCATGGKVRMRTFFTNREEMDVPFTAWVWISGLAVFDKAADLMTRVVPINFRGSLPKKRQGKDALKQFVAENRAALMAEYLIRVAMMVRAAWDNRDKDYPCEHRMSGWERLCKAAADDGGELPAFEEMFRTLAQESAAETTASGGLETVIRIWLSNAKNKCRRLDKEILFRELLGLADRYQVTVLGLRKFDDFNFFATQLGKIRKSVLVPQFNYAEIRAWPGGIQRKQVSMVLTDEAWEANKAWAYTYLGLGPGVARAKEAGEASRG